MDEQEYYENLEHEQRDLMEDQIDLQDEQMKQEQFDYPRARKPDSLFTLFKQVLGMRDSSKIGNLDKQELGMLPISVRECQRISLLANLLHHETFAAFFDDQAEITLSTSASKKGWLPELFVSQRKFTTRASQVSGEARRKKEWKMFRKKQQEGQ